MNIRGPSTWFNDLSPSDYKYDVPNKPKKPSGKATYSLFEDIDRDLYRPAAKMVSFRVLPNRLLAWSRCLHIYLHVGGDLAEYHFKWTDKTSKWEHH